MQTTIRKWGNSAGARIPSSALKAVGISVNDTVDISTDGEYILIKKGITERSVEQLLSMSPAGSFDLDLDDREWLNTPPVGKEQL